MLTTDVLLLMYSSDRQKKATLLWRYLQKPGRQDRQHLRARLVGNDFAAVQPFQQVARFFGRNEVLDAFCRFLRIVHFSEKAGFTVSQPMDGRVDGGEPQRSISTFVAVLSLKMIISVTKSITVTSMPSWR